MANSKHLLILTSLGLNVLLAGMIGSKEKKKRPNLTMGVIINTLLSRFLPYL